VITLAPSFEQGFGRGGRAAPGNRRFHLKGPAKSLQGLIAGCSRDRSSFAAKRGGGGGGGGASQ